VTNIKLPKIEGLAPLQAPAWAPSGHWQTIAAHLIPSPTFQDPLQELTIQLADGDQLKTYLHVGTGDTVVSLYHGLSGDITSDYIQRTALVCQKKGYSVLLVNHRGTHTGLTMARKPYHSGRSEDVSDVILAMRKRFPGKRQVAIGISMSGSIVLNLIAGRRGHAQPDAAITVNAPLDLRSGAINLGRGVNRLYNIRFVNRLAADLRQKYELGLMDQKLEISPFLPIYEFDQKITAPLAGFASRDDYYDLCSPKGFLHQIKCPLIMLHSNDDPFVDVSHYFNEQKTGLGEKTQLHIENVGGHVGFLSRTITPYGTYRWMDYFLDQALSRLEN